jgi:hypothetical protein
MYEELTNPAGCLRTSGGHTVQAMPHLVAPLPRAMPVSYQRCRSMRVAGRRYGRGVPTSGARFCELLQIVHHML